MMFINNEYFCCYRNYYFITCSSTIIILKRIYVEKSNMKERKLSVFHKFFFHYQLRSSVHLTFYWLLLPRRSLFHKIIDKGAYIVALTCESMSIVTYILLHAFIRYIHISEYEIKCEARGRLKVTLACYCTFLSPLFNNNMQFNITF